MYSREYGHRIKGIALSSFTMDEVKSLQQTGNAVRFRLPTSDNSLSLSLILDGKVDSGTIKFCFEFF
jgi:hypothetical protein